MSSFHLWISLSKHLLSEVLTITFREGRTTAFSTTWMQQLLPYAGFIRPSPFAWLSRLFPQSWLGNKGSLLGDSWPTTSQQQGQHPHDIHLCNSELSISRWEWRSHHITTPRGSGGQGKEQWVGRFQQLYVPEPKFPPPHTACVSHSELPGFATLFHEHFWCHTSTWETKCSQFFSALTPLCCSEALEMVCAAAGIYCWSPSSAFMCFADLTPPLPYANHHGVHLNLELIFSFSGNSSPKCQKHYAMGVL